MSSTSDFLQCPLFLGNHNQNQDAARRSFHARLLRAERGGTALRRATGILHHFPYTNLTAPRVSWHCAKTTHIAPGRLRTVRSPAPTRSAPGTCRFCNTSLRSATTFVRGTHPSGSRQSDGA